MTDASLGLWQQDPIAFVNNPISNSHPLSDLSSAPAISGAFGDFL